MGCGNREPGGVTGKGDSETGREEEKRLKLRPETDSVAVDCRCRFE